MDSIPETSIIFLAVTISTSFIILSAILYLLYYLWYSLFHTSRTAPFDIPTPLNKLHRFTFKDLRNATGNFSHSNCIGKGGSGTVYRGILKDGKLVAVKLLDSPSYQPEIEFQNELKILGGLNPSPLIVCLLGFCVEKEKRVVVYEYMPNKSLQECLFSEKNMSLNWDKRFVIILDVAKALAFLHIECQPPVIHGDIKPSNVLLDFDFRAKISDFGLSRLKLDSEIGADLFSQELSRRPSNAATDTPPVESNENDEVDFALALQASSSSKSSCRVYYNAMGLAVNSLNFNFSCEIANEDEYLSSVDHSKELNLNGCDGSKNDVVEAKQWGKDWWWRQDGSGELCSKDYVMEWIGSQICPNSDNLNWDEEKGPMIVEKTREEEVNEKPKKHRKMHEWWKEERMNDVKKKGRVKVLHFGLGKCFSVRMRRSSDGCNNKHREENDERNKQQRALKKNTRSIAGSGDLFSRELSSTTSMRGTLCYVAPEYGGLGHLMEKSDIYSFGVLILVIVSGRRPLHVLSSPMKIEQANLISWSRSLANSGNVLEIVDERLRSEYDEDEARLCINLALLCLQRMPELRPEIGDVVRILKGEMELPSMPFEFSPVPSPPPGNGLGRSRRKQKICTVD